MSKIKVSNYQSPNVGFNVSSSGRGVSGSSYQGELWGDKTDKIEEINDIFLDVSEDLHTLNMYNRIYVPEKYRFFFPAEDVDFYLSTNVGHIKTHITANGYFTKGMRSWVEVNGPLDADDKIQISIVDEEKKMYSMAISNAISNKK